VRFRVEDVVKVGGQEQNSVPVRSALFSSDLGAAPEDFLAATKIVFVEFSDGLAAANACGLPADATIKAASPALMGAAGVSVNPLERSLSRPRRRSLMDEIERAGESLRDAPWGDRIPFPAVCAARHLSIFGARYLLKAALLSEEDMHLPVAAIMASTGDSVFDERINPPWLALLANNPSLRVLRVPVTQERPVPAFPSFWMRLYLSPAARLYRIARAACRVAPWMFRRATVGILRESELLRECAVALAARGACLVEVPQPSLDKTSYERWDVDEEVALACELLDPLVQRWVTPSIRPTVLALYESQLRQEFQSSCEEFAYWRAALPRQKRKLDVLLGNFPRHGCGPGLLAAARQSNLPYASFQHGIAKEIGAMSRYVKPLYEINSSDLVFSFNEESVRASDSSRLAVGRAVAVGLPSEYRRTGRRGVGRRYQRTAPPIVYASTTLLAGYAQMQHGVLSDQERASFEVDLLQRVLGQLPHRVLFKPYPSSNYIDEAPAMAVARGLDNVEVFDRDTDLRYLLGQHRVIVTTGATSTLGYCVMSNRPLVFVDNPDQAPLTQGAASGLAEGAFLFSAGSDDWVEEMVKLLSRPIEEIEGLWKARAGPRRELVRQYFSARSDKGAGRRAARIVLAEVAKRRHARPGRAPDFASASQ